MYLVRHILLQVSGEGIRNVSIEGTTMGDAMRELGIHPTLRPWLNGEPCSEETVLLDGDFITISALCTGTPEYSAWLKAGKPWPGK